jgi:hypothetical protein
MGSGPTSPHYATRAALLMKRRRLLSQSLGLVELGEFTGDFLTAAVRVVGPAESAIEPFAQQKP